MAGRNLILEPAKAAIRFRITALFNDASGGERPIQVVWPAEVKVWPRD